MSHFYKIIKKSGIFLINQGKYHIFLSWIYMLCFFSSYIIYKFQNAENKLVLLQRMRAYNYNMFQQDLISYLIWRKLVQRIVVTSAWRINSKRIYSEEKGCFGILFFFWYCKGYYKAFMFLFKFGMKVKKKIAFLCQL